MFMSQKVCPPPSAPSKSWRRHWHYNMAQTARCDFSSTSLYTKLDVPNIFRLAFQGLHARAWRSDVTFCGSWITPDTGRAAAMFYPEIQLWTWLRVSARASKRDVRSSAQRIQRNPLNGTPGACLYILYKIKTGDQSWAATPCCRLPSLLASNPPAVNHNDRTLSFGGSIRIPAG